MLPIQWSLYNVVTLASLGPTCYTFGGFITDIHYTLLVPWMHVPDYSGCMYAGENCPYSGASIMLPIQWSLYNVVTLASLGPTCYTFGGFITDIHYTLLVPWMHVPDYSGCMYAGENCPYSGASIMWSP